MSTPVVTIFVRHGFIDGKPCKYTGDEFCRRCKCPKHLRWTLNGKQHRQKTGARSWELAEEARRRVEDQLSGRTPAPNADESIKGIGEAAGLFITDKKAQGVTHGVTSRYETELSRFQAYCEAEGVFVIQRVTRELLTGYASTWAETYGSTYTRRGVRERLRGFLRYCYEAQWLERIPPLPKVQVDDVPTMPLTPAEYQSLLDAIDNVTPLRWDTISGGKPLSAVTRQRVRALVQLMRWSGLAIQDALTLPRAAVRHDVARDVYRVVTSRQKTGTDVSVPIPKDVGLELLSVTNSNPKYLFWTGTGRGTTVARMFGRRYIRPLFTACGFADQGRMLSHRLRDTFAVDLLEKGVPMEEVSKALGHTSIKTTEKHYAAWAQSRQDRMDNLIIGTWTQPKAKRRKRAA
jgi:integrase